MPSPKPLAFASAVLLALCLPLIPVALSPAAAQSTQSPKAAADRALGHGVQQYERGQIEAALQSWQQALTLCNRTKPRLCDRRC
jgi:Tfp pilus assembly protein PilF